MADNAASNHAEFHEKKTIEKWIVLYFVSNKNRAISSSMAKTSLIYAYLYLLVGLASNQLDIWSGRHNFESLKKLDGEIVIRQKSHIKHDKIGKAGDF